MTREWLKKTAAFIAAKKEKIGTAGLAYSFDYCVNWLFNYPLYIYVMNDYGLKYGFLIMSCLSFSICLAYILIYDIIKKDLFLLEDAKEFMEKIGSYGGESRAKKLLAWIVRKGGFFSAFLILSLWKDPFYTTAFCRKGKYDGLSRRDWGIFLGSVVIGNAVWALSVFGGIEVFKRVFLK